MFIALCGPGLEMLLPALFVLLLVGAGICTALVVAVIFLVRWTNARRARLAAESSLAASS
jgi:hypothetical protein